MRDTDIEEFKSQIRRGTLEYCILSLIGREERYGYELMSELSHFPILSAKESTIYPLLRRLLGEAYLTSFWQESGEGLPPRKYYRITERGREYLALMCEQWDELTSAVDRLRGAAPIYGSPGELDSAGPESKL